MAKLLVLCLFFNKNYDSLIRILTGILVWIEPPKFLKEFVFFFNYIICVNVYKLLVNFQIGCNLFIKYVGWNYLFIIFCIKLEEGSVYITENKRNGGLSTRVYALM